MAASLGCRNHPVAVVVHVDSDLGYVFTPAELALFGRPEFESASLAAFINDYVGRRGKSGKWSDKTRAQRKADFRPLREIAERDNLKCRDLNAMHLRECLRQVGTTERGHSLRGLLRTMLVFDRHSGYFTRDQGELIDAVTWTPPVGYVIPRSRRDQAKPHVDIAAGGEVMTHEQVRAWAKGCRKRWVHGMESLSCVDQRGGFVVHIYRSDQLSVCLGCGEDLPDDGGELGVAAGVYAPVLPAGGRD